MAIELDKIADPMIRENLRRLQDLFRNQPMLRGKWRHVEIVFAAAVTNFRYSHNLGFKPKDVLPTSLIGAGAVTWNYDKFTSQFLDITTTGACTVRAFVGLYREDSDA